KTSSLRLLVAKHRTRAPDALLLIVQEAVRDHRAHDAGSRLRTQRQRVATRILEREHLLLHDVRELADRAFEKRRVLDDGHADLAIRIRSEQCARNALELVPSANLARQHVIHAARRLNLLCSGSVQRNLVYLSFRDVSLSQIAVRIDREARELASF